MNPGKDVLVKRFLWLLGGGRHSGGLVMVR